MEPVLQGSTCQKHTFSGSLQPRRQNVPKGLDVHLMWPLLLLHFLCSVQPLQCLSFFIGHFGTNFPQELLEQEFFISESMDGL